MRRLNRLAASLYPPWWRKRYGSEFAALLDDARPGLAGTFDICKEAMRIHITSLTWTQVLAVTTFLGLVAATGMAYSIQDRYVSEASFGLATNDRAVLDIFSAQRTHVFSDKMLEAIIKNDGLFPSERKAHSMEDLAAKLRASVDLVPNFFNYDGRQLYQVRASYPDRKQAQRISQEIVSQYVDGVEKEIGRSLETRGLDYRQAFPHGILYIDLPPTLPKTPESPNRLAILLTGTAVGACSGALVIWISRRKRNQPRPPSDALQASAL